MHPQSEGFLEFWLFVNDVTGSAQFYEKISAFALSAISENAAAQCKPAIGKSCGFLGRVDG